MFGQLNTHTYTTASSPSRHEIDVVGKRRFDSVVKCMIIRVVRGYSICFVLPFLLVFISRLLIRALFCTRMNGVSTCVLIHLPLSLYYTLHKATVKVSFDSIFITKDESFICSLCFSQRSSRRYLVHPLFAPVSIYPKIGTPLSLGATIATPYLLVSNFTRVPYRTVRSGLRLRGAPRPVRWSCALEAYEPGTRAAARTAR